MKQELRVGRSGGRAQEIVPRELERLETDGEDTLTRRQSEWLGKWEPAMFMSYPQETGKRYGSGWQRHNGDTAGESVAIGELGTGEDWAGARKGK